MQNTVVFVDFDLTDLHSGKDWKAHTTQNTYNLFILDRKLKQAERIFNIKDPVLWNSLGLPSSTTEPTLRGSSFKSDIIQIDSKGFFKKAFGIILHVITFDNVIR